MISTSLPSFLLGLAAFIGFETVCFGQPAPVPLTSPKPIAPPVEASTSRIDRFDDPLPNGALARFGTVRFRQGFLVLSIRYSPDEKTMAIAACGRPLGLWEVATGKELFQFSERNQPSGIAFSPDGKILVEGGHKDVRLWDTQTGKLIRALQGHTASIRAVAFSPDGNTVISGGHDSSIRFWNVMTGQEIARLDKHSDSVLVLALSRDGKLLASGGSDNVIRIWDARTRELLKELRGQAKYISTLSFSPDGRQLASASDGQTCTIWDVATGEASHKLDEGLKSMTCVTFSPNGKWLATGCNDGTIRLWNPATGKEVRRWDTQRLRVSSIVFTRDSKTIASNSAWECGARFWDVETAKEIRPTNVHRSLIDEIRLSADGKSIRSLGRDQRIIRWNLETSEPDEWVPDPSEMLFRPRATLSPSGDLLAWGSNSEKTIHLMDLRTRKPACEPLKFEATPIRMRFSPDGTILAIGCDKGVFYLWRWKTERNTRPLHAPEDDSVAPLIFTPDGKRLVISSDRFPNRLLHIWDVAKNKKLESLPGNNQFSAVAISPDGKWAVSAFYAGSTIGNIKVINVEKREVVREIKVDPQGGTALEFSADGQFLAFGGDEQPQSVVKLIEFATGETVATWNGHHSGVLALQFSQDGRMLFSAGSDSTILKWDATGRGGQDARTPDLRRSWNDLYQEASKACPAGWDLVDSPTEAVAFLRKQIPPARKLDVKEIQKHVDDLDADSFRAREKAVAVLTAIAYSAEPHLRKLIETEKRPEVKGRVQKILDELSGASFLRIQRALYALRKINNDDSKKLLHELAAGAPDSMLTKEALKISSK